MTACEHPIWEHRKRTKSNGVVVVTRQCMECGSSRGEVPKATFDLSKLQEFDQSLLDKWQELRDAEYNKRAAEFEAKQGEWWNEYNKYLCSEHWYQLRRLVLTRDPTCQRCFRAESRQAHHVSYEGYKKYGFSFAVECAGMCTPCHDLIHGRDAL